MTNNSGLSQSRKKAALIFGVFLLSIPSAFADDAGHPGIFSISPKTQLTERGTYPLDMRVGDFDGAFKREKVFSSSSNRENVVGFWESEAGVLRTEGYPVDEYCYVLEGDLLLIDADGRQQTFGPGDTFVIPKGWVGTWNMKTRFKKQFVTF